MIEKNRAGFSQSKGDEWDSGRAEDQNAQSNEKLRAIAQVNRQQHRHCDGEEESKRREKKGDRGEEENNS